MADLPLLPVPPREDRPAALTGRALGVPLVLCAAILAVLGVLERLGHPAEDLLRDPAAVIGFSPVVGAFSHLGVLAMTVTAAVCLFAAGFAAVDRRMLWQAGIFSAVLAVDDLLMLHEAVGPGLLGIPEEVFLILYAAAALALLWRRRGRLSPRRAPLLWVSMACLGLSVALDAALSSASAAGLAAQAEDVLKLAGLLFWASFWVYASSAALTGRAGPPPAGR